MENKKFILSYMFFFFITSVRFFSELFFATLPSPVFAFFHHHYWFLFVFSLFLLNFKLLLKIEPGNLLWMVYLSPVILIPVIYHFFSGQNELALQYMSGKNLKDNFADIFTFMLFNSNNKPISVELIIIFLSIAFFSFYKSRKILISVLTAIICYLCLMILGGTALISPYEEEALIFINTSMHLQLFMLFLYMSATILLIHTIFIKEIILFYGSRKLWRKGFFLSVLFLLSFSLFFIIIALLNNREFFWGDFFITTIPVYTLSQLAFFIKKISWADNSFTKMFFIFHSVIIFSGLLAAAFKIENYFQNLF